MGLSVGILLVGILATLISFIRKREELRNKIFLLNLN